MKKIVLQHKEIWEEKTFFMLANKYWWTVMRVDVSRNVKFLRPKKITTERITHKVNLVEIKIFVDPIGPLEGDKDGNDTF